MYCMKCGKKIPDESVYCPECGKLLVQNSNQDAEQQISEDTYVIKFKKVGNIETILAIVGILAWIVAVFLPFVSVSFWGFEKTANLIEGGDGWFFIIIAVVAAIVLFFRKMIIYCIVAGIGTVLSIYEVLNVSGALDSAGDYSGFFHMQAGFYFLILGMMISIISSVIIIYKRRNAGDLSGAYKENVSNRTIITIVLVVLGGFCAGFIGFFFFKKIQIKNEDMDKADAVYDSNIQENSGTGEYNNNITDSEQQVGGDYNTENTNNNQNTKQGVDRLVVDNAGLLTDEEIQELINKTAPIAENEAFDIAIVTVDTFGNTSLEDYTNDFYDNNGYQKNGIMLLLSMNERQWHMTTTGSAIESINDEALDDISTVFLPFFSRNEYYKGFDEYISKVIEIMGYADNSTNNEQGMERTDEAESVSMTVVVSATKGSIPMYLGPGEEYSQMNMRIQNNSKIVITEVKTSSDGQEWGYTTFNNTNGWINLKSTYKPDDTAKSDVLPKGPGTQNTNSAVQKIPLKSGYIGESGNENTYLGAFLSDDKTVLTIAEEPYDLYDEELIDYLPRYAGKYKSTDGTGTIVLVDDFGREMYIYLIDSNTIYIENADDSYGDELEGRYEYIDWNSVS